ncbi:hypothetical protein [Dyadobacter psychrotolerans]|uniref:Uncharacterized protein n=1 Tax=Dyadobacter psychrotolerans TaxID=2541721 RepID=A0A4R5DML5_9BACT|nr:hypothetical protein [Dyadobacter psychrotolerans]TDE15389.1 hypothetical protein E0F88_12815 [Dyadobacter psychrotolerans]
MTYIKLIFLFILMMMDRCGIISKKVIRSNSRSEFIDNQPITIDGSWRLSDMTDSLDGKQKEKSQIQEAKLLSFFPDSTFTELKSSGLYTTGKWRFTESDSALTMFYNNTTNHFKVSPDRDQSGLRWLRLASEKEKLAYGGFGRSMSQYRQDPFYLANNLWRNKPFQAETKSQIRNRLTAYLDHSLLLMKAAVSRRQQILSWEFSKGILKIYASGIGVVPEEQIPESWIDSFHSKKDALMAYAMLKEYLLTTSYKGSATGNWLQDDCDILQTIVQGIKLRKEKDLL